MECEMHRRQFHSTLTGLATLAAAGLVAPGAGPAGATDVALAGDGILRTKSAHAMADTIARITADIAAKEIMLFSVIDQAELGKAAGVEVRPSTLIIFGNPPLGTQFLTAKAESGLDWPVRLLVYEDAAGQVWTAYTDFDWIARRHGITNRTEQFTKASEVIASIVSSTSSGA
jgi:uncharacterized protein (DUF302 family)